MKRLQNINELKKLSIPDLLNLVSTRFHNGMLETFATVILQLETAYKLEPHEEELEFALATLKVMEQSFIEHIEKEKQLLFPLLNKSKKRQRLAEEENELEDFISGLKYEHQILKKQIAQIKKVTNNYTCEPAFTPSHKLAYAQLNDLEQDINRLYYVEEEYLFPKVLRLNFT